MDKLRLRTLSHIFLCFVIFLNSANGLQQNNTANLSISTHDLLIIVQETQRFTVQLNGHLEKLVNLTFQVQHNKLLQIVPNTLAFDPESSETNVSVAIVGTSPGHVEISATVTPDGIINADNIFIRVVVAISLPLITISSIIGWVYFVAWSISFYPQIRTNYLHKSVIGLNFDFLSLNILGFVLYGMFNVGLYCIPFIQAEYFRRNPRGLNPVQLNDVFFACHAVFATLFTIIQCSIYEKAEQRVSTTARSILIVFGLCVILFTTLATINMIHWLDFLYACSYIKLVITLIKYVPQAYMNYQRKSTSGWSIGNVLFDFTGGWLSMLQMMLNAYNYDDWASIFGDPTKFGLGLFSVMFDILFLIQHYVLYRQAPNKLKGEPISSI